MKKLIINIIALTGLVFCVLAIGCSVHHRPKQVHSYTNGDHNSHAEYDVNRERRYSPPRQY